MTVHEVFPAALAFILGAAFLAGGESDEELRDRLAVLRAQAERVEAQVRARELREDAPPATDNGMTFGLIAVDALTRPAYDAIPPARPRAGDNESTRFDRRASEPRRPFGVAEELIELIRATTRTETWDAGGILTALGRSLLVFNKPEVIAAARRFIDRELRPRAARTVALETRVVQVPAAQGAELGARIGLALDDDAVQKLVQTNRVFDGRILALSGQRVLLWRGGQAALLADAEVEVTQQAKTMEPRIDVELLGGILSARATARDNSDRIQLDLSMEHRRLVEPVREKTTRGAGTLQLPAVDQTRIAGILSVQSGRWVVAGEAQATSDSRRFVLVRVTVIGQPEKKERK